MTLHLEYLRILISKATDKGTLKFPTHYEFVTITKSSKQSLNGIGFGISVVVFGFIF